MKLNEIREIVDFMKEAGVCELEYKERSTSIRLKLTPPPPQYPWSRFRAAAPEAPQAQDAQAAPAEEAGDGLLDMELGEAAEKVRQGAVKAGSAVVDTVMAGASYLKSKRDEYLAGTPGAYDVELTEAEAEAPAEAPAREETPVVGEVPEYVPQSAPEAEAAPEPEEAEIPEAPVKLDTDAAREAVARTAEVVVNAAKAAVELGVAGVRRGGALLSDLLGSSEAAPGTADSPEEAPQEAEAAPEQPAEEAERKEE